jgi:MFS family permease
LISESANSDEQPLPPKASVFSAMREANYRIFAGGFFVSSLGLQALAMAIGWEIQHRTGDVFYVGLAGLIRTLPVVIMALPAGWLIDQHDRRRVLMLTQVGFALMAGVLAFASYHGASLVVMYAVLFIMGCVRSFNGPTRSSLLPDLVKPEVFPNAVTWNSGIFQISGVLGPLLGGAIIVMAGDQAWPVYALTFVGCLAFAFVSLRLKIDHDSHKRAAMSVKDLFGGAAHLWREKTILGAISLDMFAVLLGGVSALIPAYCQEILHVGPLGLGWLKAAPYIGAILMGIVIAYRPPMKNAGRSLLLSVAGFGVCMICFGLSTTFWIAFIALMAGGAFDMVSIVIRHVLVQVRTPRELRGRVSAVNSVFIESSNELGAFSSGVIGAAFGIVASAVSGGVGTLIVVGGLALAIPQLRRLKTLEPPKNGA